jgi:NDP-sugar pyrophosphorylase family protein
LIEYAVIIATGSPNHQSMLAQDRPYAMLPALGKPMIARMMDQIYQANIRKFIIVVGVSEGAVASYLNRQWVPDAKIELVFKGDTEPLIKTMQNIAKQLQQPFLVSSYNSFCHSQFIPQMIKHGHEHPDFMIMAGAKHALVEHAEQTYAIRADQHIREITKDASVAGTPDAYLVHGLTICGQHFVDYLEQETASSQFGQTNNAYFTDVVKSYLETDESKVTLAETSWLLQVESDQDLLVLNRKLLNETHDNHILSEIPYTAKIIHPVRIDPRVSIGQDAVIGPNVYLEQGSTVGYGATVKNAICSGIVVRLQHALSSKMTS